MKTLKLIFSGPIWVLFLFACTIIKDEDIDSQAELAQLKIKGIEILQETAKGNSATLATVLYDSTVNESDPATGAKITRRIRYSMPALGSFKMKLRSGLNVKTEFTVTYMDDGQPYTVRIFLGDSSVEQYRFRYDVYTGTRKVNRFLTIINPIDNLPPTYTCVDQFTYTGANVTSILRTPSSGSPYTATITYSGSATTSVSNVSIPGIMYQQNQGSCSNATAETCSGYNTNTGPNSNYLISIQQNSYFLDQVLLADEKLNSGNGRDYDTYLFHPFMFLRNQVGQGKYLVVVYMMDWWQPGAVISGPNYSKNELVTLNLKYGH